MKCFHKNSHRIENEDFIMYMLDHELVTTSIYLKIPIVLVWNLQNIQELDSMMFP